MCIAASYFLVSIHFPWGNFTHTNIQVSLNLTFLYQNHQALKALVQLYLSSEHFSMWHITVGSQLSVYWMSLDQWTNKENILDTTASFGNVQIKLKTPHRYQIFPPFDFTKTRQNVAAWGTMLFFYWAKLISTLYDIFCGHWHIYSVPSLLCRFTLSQIFICGHNIMRCGFTSFYCNVWNVSPAKKWRNMYCICHLVNEQATNLTGVIINGDLALHRAHVFLVKCIYMNPTHLRLILPCLRSYSASHWVSLVGSMWVGLNDCRKQWCSDRPSVNLMEGPPLVSTIAHHCARLMFQSKMLPHVRHPPAQSSK